MPSSSTKKSNENAGGKRGKSALPTKRAPKSREAAIAQAANVYANPTGLESFGAPVTSVQVAMYERALKALRKQRPVAQFLGFKSAEVAKRELGRVARGTARSASLPKPTRDAFDKLYVKLTALHTAEGKVNKTWPRKHAIVIHALLSEKPARKPAARKPKPTETSPAPAATPASE